jgi:hypothetical protein
MEPIMLHGYRASSLEFGHDQAFGALSSLTLVVHSLRMILDGNALTTGLGCSGCLRPGTLSTGAGHVNGSRSQSGEGELTRTLHRWSCGHRALNAGERLSEVSHRPPVSY